MDTATATAREGLRLLESAMRRQRLRAHVYLVDADTTVQLATGTREFDGQQETRGPEPVAEALREVERACGWKPDWRAMYWKAAEGTATARPVWNSAHLVVTGVSPAHALVMAAPDAAGHGPETIRRLGAAAGADTAGDVCRWYEEATGAALPPNAAAAVDEMLRAAPEER